MQKEHASLKFEGTITGKFMPGLTNTKLHITASGLITRAGLYSITTNYLVGILPPEVMLFSDVKRNGCSYFNKETPKRTLFEITHKQGEHLDEFVYKAFIGNLQKSPVGWGKQHGVNIGVKMYAAKLGIKLK